MTHAVLDTNLFVSTVPDCTSTALIDRWRAGHSPFTVTGEIVSERLHALYRPKFALPHEVVDDILAHVFREGVRHVW